MIKTHEPKTALGQSLRAQMSDRRWQREVKAALIRAAVIEAVKEERKTSGLSWRGPVSQLDTCPTKQR